MRVPERKGHKDMPDLSFDQMKTKDTSLPVRVADQISQLIIERQLNSGDKLPNEFELCNLLQVGRGTIREAVKLLVARNVLEIRRGKGTFVAQDTGEIEDPLGFTYYPDQILLARDLMEVRLHLEPWVAGLAAQRATEEDLQRICELCRQVEVLIEKKENHLPTDMQLHVSIAQCTQNLVVPKLIPIISYSVDLFGKVTQLALRGETILDHRRVVDAICARDAQGAIEAMTIHMQKNQDFMDGLIQKHLNEKKANSKKIPE